MSIGGSGGLSVTSGQLGVAILSAPVAAGDTRSWTAVTGKDIGVTLDVPGIVATVLQGSVLVNRASGLKNGVAPVAVDWAKADGTTNGLVDLNADAGYTAGSALVDPGATMSPAVPMPINVRGKKLAVAGKLTSLSIFGLISGSADFALQTSVVDVDFDGSGGHDDRSSRRCVADDVRSVEPEPERRAGRCRAGHHGWVAGDRDVDAEAPATGTDERSWSAVTGKDLAVTLNIPGITGTVSSGSVRINRASGVLDPTPANPMSGDEVSAVALNWATAAGAPLTVDLDGTGGWTAPTALVDPGAALPNPTPIPITFRGSQLAVAGSISNVDLFGLLTGGADFSVTSQLVDLDLDGSGATTTDQLNDASLVTFALTALNLRLGTSTVGLQIGPGGTVGIASIAAPVPASGTDGRSWTAVVGKDLAVSLSIPGITGSVTSGSLKINRANGQFSPVAGAPVLATALNWATAGARRRR